MDANENIVARLKQWMEDEGMSSPSEYGANTPMYIYRMWGRAIIGFVGFGTWLGRKRYQVAAQENMVHCGFAGVVYYACSVWAIEGFLPI